MVHNHRALKVYKRVTSERRNFVTEIITLVGDTGVGKTRWAYHYYPDLYSVPPPKNSGTYFDDYDDHEVVLIDEMHGHFFSYSALLRLTDRYALHVPVHGGTVNFRPKTIILTSNSSPSDWYDSIKFPWIDGPLERRLCTGPSRIYTVTSPCILNLIEGVEPFVGPRIQF